MQKRHENQHFTTLSGYDNKMPAFIKSNPFSATQWQSAQLRALLCMQIGTRDPC